ncbi:uncharacterized protein L969DRAFT_96337 [Mixia osmundae IAM 14324]|uniref:Uncharacterized protein n=1 Tax=Mixia osmundae (strain CBS 9802 / IAM 14324 / JCM 22182 / KY 12970) TaxID=764103 RepID=G7DV09_MIXOS|nr:uncharacterized protein L969DRAFT_96337 [Mixia osmundae IAM 14324]KEI37248.1 hypothetical protein L969DRAFT_96337 [Mixia osmundae IAM 14324]GAA94419.1 hypothetical protein E5Q_01071 [Mixia osmundae IAM 14324]
MQARHMEAVCCKASAYHRLLRRITFDLDTQASRLGVCFEHADLTSGMARRSTQAASRVVASAAGTGTATVLHTT